MPKERLYYIASVAIGSALILGLLLFHGMSLESWNGKKAELQEDLQRSQQIIEQLRADLQSSTRSNEILSPEAASPPSEIRTNAESSAVDCNRAGFVRFFETGSEMLNEENRENWPEIQKVLIGHIDTCLALESELRAQVQYMLKELFRLQR